MYNLQKIDVDEEKLSIFEKRVQITGTIGNNKLIFYTCDPIAVLKKQFRLVGRTQICIWPGYEFKRPSALCSGLG